MGAAALPVKSTDAEGAGFDTDSISNGLQNTSLELHSGKGNFALYTGRDMN
jgi:hypothetical protein